jgi:hypothetical protein
MRFLAVIFFFLATAPAHAQGQSQGMSQALVVSSCGGGAATNGSLTQLTMDTTGRLCQSGIGSNVCSQATNYLARTVGANEGGNAVNITALICGLVTDGVWAKLDAFYVLAQQNATDSFLNLIGTGYTITNAGVIATFTPYVGYAGFAGNGLDTGFNSTTASSPHYTTNSASFGVWVYADVSGSGTQIGSGANSHIYSDYPGFYARVNNSSVTSVASSVVHGVYAGDRPDASNVYPYLNGVSAGPLSFAATTNDNSNFLIGYAVGQVFSTETISAAFIGASLGATLELALYNRLRTYMTAVGAP